MCYLTIKHERSKLFTYINFYTVDNLLSYIFLYIKYNVILNVPKKPYAVMCNTPLKIFLKYWVKISIFKN